MSKFIKTYNSHSKGFTLVELLIVIMIIAVLSGLVLSVINPSGLRMKARDGQRVSDLKKIQAALEAYFADNRGYPVSSAAFTKASTALAALNSGKYISPVPADPSFSTAASVDPCAAASTPHDYLYRSSADLFPLVSPPDLASTYVLVTRMEVSQSVTSKCSSLNNWATLGCGAYASTVFCFGVQNP